MRVRSVTAVLLSSVMAVAMVGCAGDSRVDATDTAIELPTPTDTAATPEPTETVLDLESMTDEELLAEAKRTYQNWLDDVEEMRAEGGEDYLSLDEWTTADYREKMQTIFGESLPEGTVVKGVQSILGIELLQNEQPSQDTLIVQMCLDNTGTSFTNPEGESIKTKDAPPTSAGTVEFRLADEADRLLVHKESKSNDVSESLCAG